jgi:hypothetical protein
MGSSNVVRAHAVAIQGRGRATHRIARVPGVPTGRPVDWLSMDGADWLRTQLTSFGCAACGAPYEPGRIRLLAERDGLFFVDLACTACTSRAVAIVTVETDDDDELRADPGDLIQLAIADAPVGAPPFSTDDVLDMHRLLERFEGGTVALLARLEGGSPE